MSGNFRARFTSGKPRADVSGNPILRTLCPPPKSALPHRKHSPPSVQQGRLVPNIASFISLDLLPPEILAGGRQLEHRTVMPVPETTVHEDHRTPAGKHKVRLTWQIAMESVSQAGGV